jgi:hypothetical protein
MPCMKCSNGKYKYGEHGKCVFDTLAACKRAAAAVHVQDKSMSSNEIIGKVYDRVIFDELEPTPDS